MLDRFACSLEHSANLENYMNNKQTTSILALLALAGGASTLSADPVEGFLDEQFGKLEEAVPGKFTLNARTRYEVFDLDNGDPAADRDGSSFRIRYGYKTPDFNGLTAFIEGETLTRLGGDVDDIHPFDEQGDGTDLNQLWVQYKHEEYGHGKFGRQIYTLDDHRFIGHVGWRQNIQTFDAVTGTITPVKGLAVNPFFLDQVNNVKGDEVDLDAKGINASYKFADWLTLTGFVYNIETDDNAAIENDTVGVRATGSYPVTEDVALKYAFSFADQQEAGDAADYDASYYAGDVSAAFKGVTLGGGFEILEAGFKTPLATVHKFNGFADVFAIPSGSGIADGLVDYYVYAGYKIPVGNGISTKVIYHSFDPESGSGDYGDEIDFVGSYKWNKYLTTIVKYGDYSTDGGSGGNGGADKTMFTFEMNFVY